MHASLIPLRKIAATPQSKQDVQAHSQITGHPVHTL